MFSFRLWLEQDDGWEDDPDLADYPSQYADFFTSQKDKYRLGPGGKIQRPKWDQRFNQDQWSHSSNNFNRDDSYDKPEYHSTDMYGRHVFNHHQYNKSQSSHLVTPDVEIIGGPGNESNTKFYKVPNADQTWEYAKRMGEGVRWIADSNGRVQIGRVMAHAHLPNRDAHIFQSYDKGMIHGFINPSSKTLDFKVANDSFWKQANQIFGRIVRNLVRAKLIDDTWIIHGPTGGNHKASEWMNMTGGASEEEKAKAYKGAEAENKGLLYAAHHQDVKNAYKNRFEKPRDWFYRYGESKK